MKTIEKIITNVPLVQMKCFENNEVFTLLEGYNLCGSVKIKTVYWMLKNILEDPDFDKRRVFLEASSGNTAISLAYLGQIFGLKVEIVLPDHTALSKKELIKSYGAKITETNGTTDDAVFVRNEIFKQNPEKYFLIDQFQNENNMGAHYNITGPYLWEKFGKIDFFVAGLGTTGTILGTGKYLKEKNPDIKIIAVNPEDKIEGLRNFKTTKLKIPFYEKYKDLIDKRIDIFYENGVPQGVKKYKEEGFSVGPSSGAILTATEIFLKGKSGLRGVIISPDNGGFYE